MISYSEPLTKLEKIELYALSMHARDLKQNLRFLDYQQAEKAAEKLAGQFKTTFSANELAKFAFLPIPRGGYIVLGMLAYALNLKPNQLLTYPEQVDKPLIIVDDCSLTGFRFHQYLKKTNSPQVVFAHLLSAKSLRQRILEQEDSVSHCIAAQDLAERPLLKNSEALGSPHYWAGNTDLVAFSWSEPSLLTSLLSTNKSNEKWHLVSPQQCLNNRIELEVPANYSTIPNLYIPESLLYYWHDGVLILADSNSGEVYKLQGEAAAMWRALAVLGHQIPATNWLKAEYDLDTVSVEAFLKTAVSAGLLSRIDNDKPHIIK